MSENNIMNTLVAEVHSKVLEINSRVLQDRCHPEDTSSVDVTKPSARDVSAMVRVGSHLRVEKNKAKRSNSITSLHHPALGEGKAKVRSCLLFSW